MKKKYLKKWANQIIENLEKTKEVSINELINFVYNVRESLR